MSNSDQAAKENKTTDAPEIEPCAVQPVEQLLGKDEQQQEAENLDGTLVDPTLVEAKEADPVEESAAASNKTPEEIKGDEYKQIEAKAEEDVIAEPSEDELSSISEEAIEASKVEPAAGEEEQEENIAEIAAQNSNNIATDLAKIEPAAGNQAQGGISSGRGYGFQSSFDAQGVIGLEDVGPIDPTALQYGIEYNRDEYFLEENEGSTPLPPLNPVLEIGDQLVYEDGSVKVFGYASPESANGDLTITISGIPVGWTVTNEAFDGSDSLIGTGVFDSAAGTWTITVTGGVDFEGGPVFTPPADSDIDALGLEFAVVENDPTTGQSGSDDADFDILVDAVADDADIDATGDSGIEGATLDIDISALTGEAVNNGVGLDDGSETITHYEISGVPAGFILSAGTETVAGSGVYTLTPAEIVGLTITPTDPDYFGTLNLTATVYTTENTVTDADFDFTNNDNQASDPFTLEWKPDANPPTVKVNGGVDDAEVKEDGSVDVGIEAALDPVGSGNEILTVTVTGIDSSWGFSAPVGVYDAPSGTWTITMPAGTDLATTFTFTPPADSDLDMTGLQATASAYEPATDTTAYATPDDFQIITDAVADAPSIDATGDTGVEGTTLDIDISALTGEAVNNGVGLDDGSETITHYEISGVPAGFILSAGVETAPNSGFYTLTPSEIAGLQITPTDPNYSGSLNLTVTVFTTENLVSDDEFDYTDNDAQASDVITLKWTPEIDPPSIKVNNGQDDAIVKEDGSVDVPITAELSAGAAPSEFLTVTVTGIDPAWGGFSASEGTYTPATGTWTVTLPAGEALDATFTFTPNPDEDIDLTGLVATAVATDPTAGISADASDNFNVITDAVADIPNLDAGDKATGEEGTTIPLTITTSVNDTDGSEIIEVIKITNVPAGVTLTAGTYNAVNDVWELAPADLVGLGMVVPDGVVGTFTLDVESVAYEQNTNGAEIDLTDNRASAFDTIKVCVNEDHEPVVKDDLVNIDETNLSPITSVDGDIVADFGNDNPGEINGNGTYNIGGLTSAGVPVDVAFDAPSNTYTGTAGAEDIFTLVVNTDGSYIFTLQGVIDHPDTTDHNDFLPLEFGVTATDSDNDSADATITVRVFDDGLTANDDSIVFDENDGYATGNVVANDDLSNDTPNLVTQIKFGGNIVDVPANGSDVTIDGQFGTLTINNTGDYTYDLFADAFGGIGGVGAGGGTSLDPVQSDADGQQDVISKNGITVSVANAGDFDISWLNTSDGNGLGIDNLSNGDSKKVWPKGETFDVDFDQAADTATITIAEIGSNSDFGQHGIDFVIQFADGSSVVAEQQFVPSEIVDGVFSFTLNASDYGDQLITGVDLYSSNDGEYSGASFLLNNVAITYPGDKPECVADEFEYVLTDGDFDNDSAVLKIKAKADDQPVVKDDMVEVDETDLAPYTSASGNIAADFGSDDPGVVVGNGASYLAGATSNGQPILVEFDAITNTYTGTAGANSIFTLVIQSNGDYIFTLQGVVDHPDADDHNDALVFGFGARAIDSDGDYANATISVKVFDDGLTANDDVAHGISNDPIIGNVVANDDLSNDTPNLVTQVKFGGNIVDVPANGSDVTIDGQFGTLTINNTGDYTYDVFADTFKGKGGVGAGGGTSFDPVQSDADGQQDVISKNGITVSVANAGDFDISWLNTSDGNGLGIDNLSNGDSKKVWPKGETFDIDFDQAADTATITIAEIGSNNNFGQHGVDFVIQFADGSSVVAEQQFVPSEIVDGVFSFTLNASDYGDQLITGVDLYSSNDGQYSGASFLLNNVAITYPGDCPECVTDEFEYVLTDGDFDTDTASLTIEACPPEDVLIVGRNVDDTENSDIPHLVNGDEGVIEGGRGADILVGDAGGSFLEPQTQDYNFVFIVDVSGSMADPSGDEAGSASKLSLMVDALENLLGEFGNYDGGEIKVHITPFATDVKPSATFTVTNANELAMAIDFVNALGASGYTNYESPLIEANDWLQGSEPLENAITTTYFFSDGNPNKYIDANGNIAYNANGNIVMEEITGSDGSDDVALLHSLNDDVIAVGIEASDLIMSRLDVIDLDGGALRIDDASDLTVTLADTNPIDGLLSVGGDDIRGGDGNDAIFGDVLFTDDLADLHGLITDDGSGWEVFERLENGESAVQPDWTRDDTVSYIRSNPQELAQESLNSQGEGRNGGDDVIDGGAGNDVIFGQEGDDIITGGAGSDVIFGGSGADTIIFNAIEEGLDDVVGFDTSEGDQLDLSSLLSGYDSLTDDIADFVIATESFGSTTISVDTTGNGGAVEAFDLAVLHGVTGLDLDAAVKTDTVV